MGIKESAKIQFGKQAEAYAKGNIFVDVVHLSEVVKRSGVEKNHRVLDIATGAGFLALEFAKSAETVLGCDLTLNMILKAREKEKTSGLENTGFLLSDVESLPFPDESFDIVSCRFAFHHFPNPEKALLEMIRVCRDRLVLVDGVSSEDMEKSIFHNSIEKMRDPSHVRINALSEIEEMFNEAGADITDITHWEISQDFEEWMRRAGTDEKQQKIIEDLMLQSQDGDRTGLQVTQEKGKIGFTYDTIILTAKVRR
ncbi:MAG: methyltransferase domain-containing protein [Euryarchaeota archaeon]|nr:methyltransferase domain-containing protein [Euryarchaeota archaeon]MCG2734859.1 methyltransferase domain-containing protein [Candidatus Methanoperedenaceae archaeon]